MADWIDSRLAAAVAPVVDILGSRKKLALGQWGNGLCTEHQQGHIAIVVAADPTVKMMENQKPQLPCEFGSERMHQGHYSLSQQA